jgi:hypothetical protein
MVAVPESGELPETVRLAEVNPVPWTVSSFVVISVSRFGFGRFSVDRACLSAVRPTRPDA